MLVLKKYEWQIMAYLHITASRYFTLSCVFALVLLCSACAAPVTHGPQVSKADARKEAAFQQQLYLEKRIKDEAKLVNISYPIMQKNADLCGQQTTHSYGLNFWQIQTLPAKYHAAARDMYQLGQMVQINHVAKGGPAAHAGLKSGDIILAANHQDISASPNGIKHLYQISAQSPKQMNLVYQRQGQIYETTLIPTTVCAYPIHFIDKSEINAYADGQNIIITSGIFRYAENESELALIIAHELAHNTMQHIQKNRVNTLAGGLSGLLLDTLLAKAGTNSGQQFTKMGQQLGATAHSVAFESEADYVGMYYLRRAGYDTSNVGSFWRRMAADGQASIASARTHPATSERFLAIDKTHREIENKVARGLPLLPNLKQK